MNFEKESLKKFSFLQFLPMRELILKRRIAIIFLIIGYSTMQSERTARRTEC